MRKLVLLALLLPVLQHCVHAQTLAGGGHHTHFICTDSTAWSCGSNSVGQLGIGLSYDWNAPFAVDLEDPVVGVDASNFHTLFLMADGTVRATGSNFNGELGDGTNLNHYSPLPVLGLTGVVDVAAGEGFSVFLKGDGTVWACGNGGALGTGDNLPSNVPVQSLTPPNITAIAAGYYHTLYLCGDGTVWSTGANTLGGELGTGSAVQQNFPTPVQVIIGTDVVAMEAGNCFSLFLKANGDVWACGQNGGVFGTGTTQTGNPTPIPIISTGDVRAISAGANHSLFLRNDSTVWSTGLNTSGQLGDGTGQFSDTLVQVLIPADVIRIASGSTHALFVRADASIWGCGSDNSGELGNGAPALSSPVPVLMIEPCDLSLEVAAGEQEQPVKVWPCPAQDIVHIRGGFDPGHVVHVRVIDATGRIVNVQDQTLRDGELQLDLRAYTPGLYSIALQQDKRTVWRNLIKE